MRVIWAPRSHLEMSGDIFGRHIWGKWCYGILCVEARAAAKHPAAHRTASHIHNSYRELYGPNVNSPEITTVDILFHVHQYIFFGLDSLFCFSLQNYSHIAHLLSHLYFIYTDPVNISSWFLKTWHLMLHNIWSWFIPPYWWSLVVFPVFPLCK